LRWDDGIAFLAMIGRTTLAALASVGRFTLFMFRLLRYGLTPPYYGKQLVQHIIEMGYFSLPVVALTALFTGMVLALQTYTGFARLHAEGAVAHVVVVSLTRELGPVLAGLMVAGRLGAAMAAEISTMGVTEQLDALVTLSTHPLRYLVMPRLVAGLLTLPFLVLIADILGVLGSTLVSVHKLGLSTTAYLTQTTDAMKAIDVISGLVKALIFGGIIVIAGCYHGYVSRGGARGVGRATTQAVVTASVFILLANYALTVLFFGN
jgi:phospholipid/cholesterol/gamma-HCH transport system permease protein